MYYEQMEPAIFLERPNRFIAVVDMEGRQEVCHVKNTGRCRELLIPGAHVLVQRRDQPGRSTRYDLISVWKGRRLINMDSSAPNRVFGEWVRQGSFLEDVTRIRPEYSLGGSRFDFYLEAGGRPVLVEVKGVTLEEAGVVRFPDAPTQRGLRHLEELTAMVRAGREAWVVFIIQLRGVRWLEPSWETHPAFGQALRTAREAGVHLLALDCDVTRDSITAAGPVELRL